MKSATTSLCSQLGSHPDVFFPAIKEPDFFSRDEVYAKGWDWYQSLFQQGRGCSIIGEGSTSYTKQLQYPNAANRLFQHVPDARLIYIVRNPIKRLESHWAHEVLKGRTNLTPGEFVRLHAEAIDISRYWKQINVYRALFPEDQILILFLDDYRDQPANTLQRCCEFLKLPQASFAAPTAHENQSSDRKRDVFPISMLRRQRWFDVRFEQLKQKIPARLHPALKLIFKSRKAVGASTLDPETLTWAKEQLVEDSTSFLRHCGKPDDYWNWHPTQIATE